MAVTAVTSNYNVRRRKQSVSATVARDDSPRLTKRVKVDKRDVFTPPASPEATDLLTTTTTSTTTTTTTQRCYDDDYDDAVLIGIFDLMQRLGGSAMCSREISEHLLTEGKVHLSGATPSTVVDAAIKQHHKRCSSNNRTNIIQKVADPRFPRKTLYHLANADPFAPRPNIITPVASLAATSPEPQSFDQAGPESEASDDESEADHLDTLSNDGQGPFAASLDIRRRMSLSPSPELEFVLSIEDARRAVPTPVVSVPPTPSKEQLTKEHRRAQLNIDVPPSPFITPRQSADEGEDTDADAALELDGSHNFITNSSNTRTRDFTNDDDDLYDVDVQSPEAVSLDDLDCLLGF